MFFHWIHVLEPYTGFTVRISAHEWKMNWNIINETARRGATNRTQMQTHVSMHSCNHAIIHDPDVSHVTPEPVCLPCNATVTADPTNS